MNTVLLSAVLSLSVVASAQTPPAPTPIPQGAPVELRGLWVDAFGPGIKTPAEVDQLVADARAMNVNVIFAQVGRRGDCYCLKAAMPPTDDPAVPAGFDPLADLIEKAHPLGLQVHAWIITTAIWNSPTPPKSPAHAFNAHGPDRAGQGNWILGKFDGTVKAGSDWLLDPGHPDAAEYIRNMYVSVVRNYDVDGIQFDRVRYPDFNPVGGPNGWGYNETALARFRAETGASGTPAPEDPAWAAWRRAQVTNLVRDTALAVKAVRPDVSVNAATITYGAGPTTDEGFTGTRTYNEVLQDWLTWVREGYLDLNVMMNYKRDFVPEQAGWFNTWAAYAAGLRVRSPEVTQVSGASIYLNDQASTLNQVRKTRGLGLGWAGYSYRTPDADVNAGKRTPAEVLPELTARLTGPGGPFASPARWVRPDAAALRALRGTVTTAGTAPLGGRTVRLLAESGEELAHTTTNGLGGYGFLRVPDRAVRVEVGGVTGEPVTAPAGRVTDLPVLTLP
ncbi:family 10 glycosylhydrolase [Deinococcus aestuarii]|uniref:family 10 glycosylhydrolase n=1 Tax=Deinococcus aestuarii TaxID=2774531 RepID=UPI001C0B1C7B|nr:family 10 glycosylhydrolase [Deinococcus aestuarii]